MSKTPNAFSTERASLPLITTLGLLKQDNYDDFVSEFPDLVNLGYIMTAESLGALKYTPTHTFKHYVDANKPLPSFEITADVTGAAGVAVVATLTAASHLVNGTKSPVALGQLWEDDFTGRKYEVTAVNDSVASAHTVTLNPIKKTAVTALTAATSFFKFIGHVNVKEASSATQGIYTNWETTSMETAIIRTDQRFTDLVAFEDTVIDDQKYMALQRSEEEDRYVSTQEMQLMFGEQSDNLKHSNNMNTKSIGLVEQIKAAGATYNAPNSGVVDEDFFRGLKRRQSATGLTNEYHALLDTELTIKWDDFMSTYAVGGSIVYGSFNGDKQLSINRNFDSFSIYNMTYHRREYAYLNSARTHGANVNTGINRNSGIFIPQGELTIKGKKFKKFNVRWQGESASDSIIRVVKDGALFGQGTTMYGEVGHVTYKAVQAFQLQSYAYVRV